MGFGGEYAENILSWRYCFIGYDLLWWFNIFSWYLNHVRHKLRLLAAQEKVHAFCLKPSEKKCIERNIYDRLSIFLEEFFDKIYKNAEVESGRKLLGLKNMSVFLPWNRLFEVEMSFEFNIK